MSKECNKFIAKFCVRNVKVTVEKLYEYSFEKERERVVVGSKGGLGECIYCICLVSI